MPMPRRASSRSRVIGSNDRSFVQWQGRGPTNRRRGFDSLDSDRRVALAEPDPSCDLHFPRSKVVSRPLKPVTLVRFQLGNRRHGGRGVLECTPRCERGGAGSIPAGHPEATTGCGSMAGHLARNQVHAGSIPAAQTEAAHKRGRDAGLEMDQHQGRALGCRDALQATRGGFDSLAVHGPVDYSEMSAPSQGAGPGSTPGRVTTSHWSTRRRMPDFQSGERGSTPRWDTASRVLPNGRQPVPKTGVVVMSPRGSIPPLSSAPNLRAPRVSLYPGRQLDECPDHRPDAV